MKRYALPSGVFLPRGDKTERLYGLEEAAVRAVEESARELGQVLAHPVGDFWTHTLPEALYSLLEAFDPGASEAAALGYLALRLDRYRTGRPRTSPAALASGPVARLLRDIIETEGNVHELRDQRGAATPDELREILSDLARDAARCLPPEARGRWLELVS